MEPIKIDGDETLTEPQRQTAVRLEKLGVQIEVRGEAATGLVQKPLLSDPAKRRDRGALKAVRTRKRPARRL